MRKPFSRKGLACSITNFFHFGLLIPSSAKDTLKRSPISFWIPQSLERENWAQFSEQPQSSPSPASSSNHANADLIFFGSFNQVFLAIEQSSSASNLALHFC